MTKNERNKFNKKPKYYKSPTSMKQIITNHINKSIHNPNPNIPAKKAQLDSTKRNM